jgi:hypothetical protein
MSFSADFLLPILAHTEAQMDSFLKVYAGSVDGSGDLPAGDGRSGCNPV